MFFLKDIHLVTLVTALQLVGYRTHKQNSCTTEHSLINVYDKIYDAVWKSKSSSYYSVVLSDPPCLDANRNLAARVCFNSTWTTSQDGVCYSVEENGLCPFGFIQEETSCVFITEPQISEKNCPFRGASSKIKKRYNLVWLPVKRLIQYGPFEYILPGENYGLDFFDEHSSEVIESNSDTDEDCLIIRNNGVELSSCNSVYPHVCSYKYNQFLYRCPRGCVSGGLGSNYCFCKVQNASKKSIKRSEWCKTLAAPRYSYERNILQKLVGDDTCWVGDLQQNSLIRQDYFRGSLYLAINKREWSLHINGELNCAICKVAAISYDKVDLMLTFNSKSRKLYLNVYSPESLFSDDEEDLVYCFTDATDTLKTRVEVEGTWDSSSELVSGRRLKVFRVSLAEDGPGYYWCEAFQLPDIYLIKSNVIVAYKEFKGREYSLRLVVFNLCRFSITECKNPSVSFITHIIKNLFNSRFLSKFIKKVRLFHIYNIDIQNERVDVLLHLTSHTKLPLVAEYFLLNRILEWLKLKQIFIVFFRSSEACLPESTLSEDVILHWTLSAIGTIKTPEEVCIQENGTPVRRQCQGDFRFGSEWGKVEGFCSKNVKLSAKTELLHSLVSSDVSTNVTKNISAVTENSTDLTILDLHYLAEALSKVSALNETNYEEFIDEISQIIDNLMKANTTTMKLSQILLNATDEILDTFENTLLSTKANDDVFLLKKSNLIIQISKPFLNNITGLVLYGDDDMSFSDSKVVQLYANTSFDSLLDDDDLEVAVYVPEKLLSIISQNLTNGTKSNFTIITTVYYSDRFFNSDVNVENTTVSSKVVSVSIPGYSEFLQTAIPIVFRSQKHPNQQECAFWKYGTSSETRSGYWSTIGGNYLGQLNNTSLEVCSFTHLTNFALLVLSDKFSASGDTSVSYNFQIQNHDEALTVISNTGCLLSLLGIFGIFITSVVFQTWREKVGTKILLQLCITIFLQIIFLNVADVGLQTSNLSLNYCTTVGIILHYVIISEFCWMLVAAVLQFFRFVKVIGPMPNHLILKAMLVGWGLPVFPVVIVCIFDYQSYTAGIQGLCYPKGTSMYLGVLFPISLIICTNLAVFIAVIRNVLVLKVEARSNSQTILKQQICLAILLFFLLGLPWVFGLLAEIVNHDSVLSHIFVYLFCFTASVQGFVLFIFYVVLDKSTRKLWYKLFKKLLNRKLC